MDKSHTSKSENVQDTDMSQEESDNESKNGQESKNYTIHTESTKISQKYSVMETTYRVQFHEDTHGDRISSMREDLLDMFSEVLEKTETYSDNDRARIVINHDQLTSPIFIHCQPKHQITADTIMER